MATTYHKVHCPRCGKVIMANELAFDFGEIINIALDKAKNRNFGATEEWYELKKYNLCLYLTLDDLVKNYGIKQKMDNSYGGLFRFTVRHLQEQLIKLANSKDSSFNIDTIINNENRIEFNALTKAMAKSSDEDYRSLLKDIQGLANKTKKSMGSDNQGDTEIVSFEVEVRMQKDDQGNLFANRLIIEFDDTEKKNITRFVCSGREGGPCGKILYGQAGQYKEIIIGMAGTARVGKTAYLASLLACILRKDHHNKRLGHPQRIIKNIAFIDDAYRDFERDLLEPYVKSDKIKKTENIFDAADKGTAAVSLFSMTFAINGGKSYIFTFIDMPGEVYDEDGDVKATDTGQKLGMDVIENKRRIIKSADVIWTCISAEQVLGQIQPGPEQVNVNWAEAVMNLGNTMRAIDGDGCAPQAIMDPENTKRANDGDGRVPQTVIITKSDIAEERYGLCHKDFNPFEGADNPMKSFNDKDETTPWVSVKGQLYFSNMKWFIEKTFAFISERNDMAQDLFNHLGRFTPFAVASYGRNIDNFMALVDEEDDLPEPSMIEGPFLWTLGVLGLIDVVEEVEKTITTTRGFIFKKTVVETKQSVEKIEDINKLFYYPINKAE